MRHLRPALLLGLAGALTIPLLFPYVFAVMPQVAAKLATTGIPLWMVISAQTAQAFVFIALMAWAGLAMGSRLGLDAPWVRAVARSGERPPGHASHWLVAAVLGLVSAGVLLGVDRAFAPFMPAPLHAIPPIDRWKGLLASFYGGITEEIVARLFVMTLVAWFVARLARGADARVYWAAIALAALLFGAGHLPAAIQVFGAVPVNIARTLVLNAIPGVVFGWLYWKRGLEHAMVAHFCADLVVHVAA